MRQILLCRLSHALISLALDLFLSIFGIHCTQKALNCPDFRKRISPEGRRLNKMYGPKVKVLER